MPNDNYRLGDIDLHWVPTLEECDPGIEEMCEFNILIAPVVIPERRTSSGLILADQTREQMNNQTQVGCFIAGSPFAFGLHKFVDEDGNLITTPPSPGDIVRFARFAGILTPGRDDREYRACKDQDVIAIIRRKANRLPRPEKETPNV